MSKLSSMILTKLAEFHNVANMAQHPSREASCILTSRQYHFRELTLSWFLSAILPSSFVWTGDESKHLGSDAPPIKATLMQPTGASLFGVDETPSASCSSWLSLEHCSLDHAESWFKPLWCSLPASLTSSIGHCSIWEFPLCFDNTLTEFTKQQQLLWVQRLKRKF